MPNKSDPVIVTQIVVSRLGRDVAIIGGLWRGLFVGRNVSRVAIVLVTRPCRFANELGAAVRCPRDATLMLNAIEFARLRCVTKAISRHALASGCES